eukprot:Nk52_evm62s153 gene=Nk52_evmTU62s153
MRDTLLKQLMIDTPSGILKIFSNPIKIIQCKDIIDEFFRENGFIDSKDVKGITYSDFQVSQESKDHAVFSVAGKTFEIPAPNVAVRQRLLAQYGRYFDEAFNDGFDAFYSNFYAAEMWAKQINAGKGFANAPPGKVGFYTLETTRGGRVLRDLKLFESARVREQDPKLQQIRTARKKLKLTFKSLSFKTIPFDARLNSGKFPGWDLHASDEHALFHFGTLLWNCAEAIFADSAKGLPSSRLHIFAENAKDCSGDDLFPFQILKPPQGPRIFSKRSSPIPEEQLKRNRPSFSIHPHRRRCSFKYISAEILKYSEIPNEKKSAIFHYTHWKPMVNRMINMNIAVNLRDPNALFVGPKDLVNDPPRLFSQMCLWPVNSDLDKTDHLWKYFPINIETNLFSMQPKGHTMEPCESNSRPRIDQCLTYLDKYNLGKQSLWQPIPGEYAFFWSARTGTSDAMEKNINMHVGQTYALGLSIDSLMLPSDVAATNWGSAGADVLKPIVSQKKGNLKNAEIKYKTLELTPNGIRLDKVECFNYIGEGKRQIHIRYNEDGTKPDTSSTKMNPRLQDCVQLWNCASMLYAKGAAQLPTGHVHVFGQSARYNGDDMEAEINFRLGWIEYFNRVLNPLKNTAFGNMKHMSRELGMRTPAFFLTELPTLLTTIALSPPSLTTPDSWDIGEWKLVFHYSDDPSLVYDVSNADPARHGESPKDCMDPKYPRANRVSSKGATTYSVYEMYERKRMVYPYVTDIVDPKDAILEKMDFLDNKKDSIVRYSNNQNQLYCAATKRVRVYYDALKTVYQKPECSLFEQDYKVLDRLLGRREGTSKHLDENFLLDSKQLEMNRLMEALENMKMLKDKRRHPQANRSNKQYKVTINIGDIQKEGMSFKASAVLEKYEKHTLL